MSVHFETLHVEGDNNRFGVSQCEHPAPDSIIAWMLANAPIYKVQPGLPCDFEPGLTDDVMDDEHFQSCVQGSGSTLFLHGDPGVGKTSTVLGILNRLPSRDPTIRIAFTLFKAAEDRGIHSAEGVAMNLLYQLCREDSSKLLPCIRALYDDRDAKQLTLMAIILALATVIQESKRGCIIILDALDECNDKKALSDLLKALRQLQEATRVGILLADRSKNAHAQTFRRLNNRELFSLRADIEEFVTKRLKSDDSSLRDEGQAEHGLFKEALRAIVDCSEDSFLVAELNTEYIRKGGASPREIYRAIKILRVRDATAEREHRIDYKRLVLDKAFERNIDRVLQANQDSRKGPKWAKLIIRFVRDAWRPLTDLELQHALDAYYREDESEPVLGAGSRVLDCCMGLVKVDRDRKVHLFHKTLREFLETQYDKEFPRSNLELGISCLNYLSMDKFSSGWCNDSRSVARLQKELPFADYASQHWAYHLKQYFNESKSGSLMDCNSSLQSLAMKFLQSRQKVQSAWQMYTLEGPLVISVSSLPGSSQGDLYIMVEKNEKKIEAYAPGEFSGLHLVCELGLHFLVEPLLALLGSSALENEDGSKRRPLYFAVASGDEKSIKKLLDAGANPDCRDLRNTSPLHIAARTGDTAILQLLLTSKQKVDLNARTEDYHEFRVHIRHADPRSGRTLSSPGMTALHFAAWNGHIASVKALCNCSELDANVTDTDGMSALHLAAKGKSPNHFEIVKMLAPAKDKSLTPFRGIDPQLRSYDGRTALHLAAKYMKLNIVEHLTSLEPIAWYIEDNDLLTVDETMAWFCENDEIAEKILSIKPSGGNRTRTPEECKILLQSISTRLRKRLNRSRVPAVHRCERIHEPVLPARRRWSLGQNQSPIDTSPINIPRRGENIQPALRSRPAVIDENSRRRKPHQALQRRYTVQTSTSSTSTSPKAVNSCPRLKSHSDFSSGTPCTCGLNKYLATVPGRIWNKRILEDTSQARQWPRFKCDPESDREESERKQSSPTKAAYLSRTDLAEDGLRANTGKERSSGSKEDSCCADSDVAEIDPKAETIRSMVLVLYIAVTCFICCRTWLGRG